MNHHKLDCCGLNCPMPIVQLTKQARVLSAGERIEVSATDLAFKPDVEAWARRMGHTIESFESDGEVQTSVILLGVKP